MRFFFPDSVDQIDPRYDFLREQPSPHRIRQRDELYAHEALGRVPYDGILVSKAVVVGVGSAGRFTAAHRNRLYREGAHRFYRLDQLDGEYEAMGDCGAFAYVKEAEPPYTVDEVIDFYSRGSFDFGFAMDHIVMEFVESGVKPTRESRRRQRLTLKLADSFFNRCDERAVTFTPIGVAQGWDPASYAHAVNELQKIGFSRIALGGMVALKTPAILATLEEVAETRDAETQLHLLGVTRVESIPRFAEYGVTSFDSTSPFLQAFMDQDDNYYTLDDAYCAVRIPPSDGNTKLRMKVRSGELSQELVLKLENEALKRVRMYADGRGALRTAVRAVADYEEYVTGTDPRRDDYEKTLGDAPWRSCKCRLCKEVGVEVVIFRGTERNKRRGFHNLGVFRERLDRSAVLV